MTPVKYNFRDRYNGATSPLVEFRLSKTEEEVTTPIDITGCKITMDLTNSSYEFDNDNYFQITDAENGIFVLNSFIVDLPPLTYDYDLIIEFSDGTIYIYSKGIFKVI